MRSLFEYIDDTTLKESDSFKSRSLNLVIGNSQTSELPVDVIETKWQILTDPERMVRLIKFKKFSLMLEFINQLLRHQEAMGHHASITISHKDVRIEVYTRDVNQITELDKELSQFIDDLYEDIKYYNMISKGREI